MQKLLATAVGVAVIGVFAPVGDVAALTFTCSTVARRGDLDPAGAAFKSRYDSPAINGAGDVAFVAYAQRAPRRLYHYPSVGAPTVVAQQGGAAPGGGSYKKFRAVSIDDAGDVAFHATLASGEGVFAGPVGAVAKAAATGDASPAGGAFDRFPAQSRVNAAGDVAFAAQVGGGPNGVFLYDASGPAVVTVALVNDAALDGRELCEFLDVGLGASGAVAVRAVTKVDCTNPAEPALVGIYEKTGLGVGRVALEGDASPSPSTTYAQFIGAPDVNAADKVLFRARTVGVAGGYGLFLHDPVGPTTVILAKTGDAAPATGGSLKTIAPAGVTDADRVALGARLTSGLARIGIFLFDATPSSEKVVATNDPVPTDAFGPNSVYAKINPGNRKNNEGIGVDRSGTWIAYTAKVKDTTGTPTADGVLRCQGT
jgi:hypothetical protein